MTAEYVLNRPSSFTCPECCGALAKIEGDPIPKYACHIGHVLTGEAMLDAQADRIEEFLTSALAMLNERRELCRQMLGEGITDAARLQATLADATERAEAIRAVLNEHGSTPISMEEDQARGRGA
jgi:two-component system, chemotaxis family, protein-glutamate methylesterase/glutaminase